MRLAFPSMDGMRDSAAWARSLPRARRIAAGATALWAVLVVAYAIGFLVVAAGTQSRGTVFLDAMFFLVTLVLPLILIWLAACLAEELERQRAVIAALAELAPPLIGSLDAVRDTLRTHGPASPQDIQKAVHGAMLGTRGPDPSQALERLERGQAHLFAQLEALARIPPPPAVAPAAPSHQPEARPRPRPKPPAPTQPSPTRPAPAQPAPTPPEGQPELPMMPRPDTAGGPAWPDLIRALDFPRDADDREGFRALRSALRHHSLAQMLQAAEDVLDLLSQEGVFMDDLALDPPDPDAWRRFIAGGRGAEVAGVGGIHDAQALEVTRGLMKSDPIFRDTALFLQRRFDVVLSDFARDANDAQLAELANTRSARAFALLARLSGSLD